MGIHYNDKTQDALQEIKAMFIMRIIQNAHTHFSDIEAGTPFK
jgi:hypothetical protein